MASVNEYYIIPLNLLKNPLLGAVVQDADTVRKNIAGTHCVVKTYDGVVDHPALTAHTKYTHEEILVEMNKPTWSENPV